LKWIIFLLDFFLRKLYFSRFSEYTFESNKNINTLSKRRLKELKKDKHLVVAKHFISMALALSQLGHLQLFYIE